MAVWSSSMILALGEVKINLDCVLICEWSWVQFPARPFFKFVFNLLFNVRFYKRFLLFVLVEADTTTTFISKPLHIFLRAVLLLRKAFNAFKLFKVRCTVVTTCYITINNRQHEELCF